MAALSSWEGLLEEEIKEVERVLEKARATKMAHMLSVALIVERRLVSAFELKKSYRDELNKTKSKSTDRNHHANRLQELDQELLAHQINWDIMSNEAHERQKRRKEKEEEKKRKEHDEASVADSTASTISTVWTTWSAGWSAASASAELPSTKTPTTSKEISSDKNSKSKSKRKSKKIRRASMQV